MSYTVRCKLMNNWGIIHLLENALVDELCVYSISLLGLTREQPKGEEKV